MTAIYAVPTQFKQKKDGDAKHPRLFSEGI
jgi:hypothetical protein